MKTMIKVLIVSMLINTTAYADDWEVVTTQERGLSDSVQVDMATQERMEASIKAKQVDLMTPTNVPSEGKQNPICMQQLIYKTGQLEKEQILNRILNRDYKEEKSRSSATLWFVIGIVAGGAAGYFGAKSLNK